MYNVLNWLHSVEWYLRQCRVRPEDYASYVRSYLARVVQAWMDGWFPVKVWATIPWDDLAVAMVMLYLPPDHNVRLKLVFERTVQRTTLLEYVARFQIVDSAVQFAELVISNEDKVLQFMKGLQKHEDRRFLLERFPKDLDEVYNCVNTLRQAKTLTSVLVMNPRNRSPDMGRRKREFKKLEAGTSSLNKLEGKAKQKAWDEGACLECGEKGHMIRDCPHRKRDLKRSIRKYVREAFKAEGQHTYKPSSQQKGGKKKRLHKLDSQDEAAEEEKEVSSSTSSMTESSEGESDSSSEQSENSEAESRG